MFTLPTSQSDPPQRSLFSSSEPNLHHCLTTPIAPAQLGPTQLDFEDLAEFERLKDQYCELGVRFDGAIAIQPSNPIFTPRSGALVLIPASCKLGISAQFCRPVCVVRALVSGTRQVVLTALDEAGNVLGKVSIGTYQYMLMQENEHLEPLPQQELQLEMQGIAKVVFESDTPFTLDDFFFSEF